MARRCSQLQGRAPQRDRGPHLHHQAAAWRVGLRQCQAQGLVNVHLHAAGARAVRGGVRAGVVAVRPWKHASHIILQAIRAGSPCIGASPPESCRRWLWPWLRRPARQCASAGRPGGGGWPWRAGHQRPAAPCSTWAAAGCGGGRRGQRGGVQHWPWRWWWAPRSWLRMPSCGWGVVLAADASRRTAMQHCCVLVRAGLAHVDSRACQISSSSFMPFRARTQDACISCSGMVQQQCPRVCSHRRLRRRAGPRGHSCGLPHGMFCGSGAGGAVGGGERRGTHLCLHVALRLRHVCTRAGSTCGGPRACVRHAWPAPMCGQAAQHAGTHTQPHAARQVRACCTAVSRVHPSLAKVGAHVRQEAAGGAPLAVRAPVKGPKRAKGNEGQEAAAASAGVRVRARA